MPFLPRSKRRPLYLLFFGLLLSLLASPPAEAQLAPSGFELALHGSPQVMAGKSARFRGVAYRVRGLAQLQPLAGARLRVRFAMESLSPGAWREFRADRSGFFQIDLPIPEDADEPGQLEIEVGDGKEERVFSFPLSFSDSWKLDLMTDRKLYEPGETIHAWARFRDRESRRPLPGRDIAFTFTGSGIKNQAHKTGASGVASAKVLIPKEAKEGHYQLIARIGGREISRNYEVGTRTYERLFAELKVTPKRASPHQAIDVQVKVTTASGALVRNAEVKLKLETTEVHGMTDGNGVVKITMRAPAYMAHATGSVSISAEVKHAAHGETKAYTSLGLEVPLTLSVEAVPGNSALVPGLDGLLYVRLSKGDGKPPALGTPIEVSGAAIAGGRARGVTDKHGFVTIATRLPRGAATGENDDAVTTIIVKVKGAAPRTASIEVAVSREAEVVPTVNKAVVAPGEDVVIKLRGRPSAAKSALIVELLAGSRIVEARKLAPGTRQVKMKAPRDTLGVITIRARPLHQKTVVEGTGSADAFLVRPPHPSFPTLSADKEVYGVGASAKLTLQTAPGAGQSWVALLVRDLAAHSGEVPFRMHFLARAFKRAILDPNSKAANTLLRTALADWIYADRSPQKAPELLDELGEEGEEGYNLDSSKERGVLRDPFPLADELSRRGVGVVMRRVEEILSEALQDGRLSDVATRSGNRSRFKASLFDEFEEPPLSLGEGELSLDMLYAADSSFRYDNVARRVARRRLVELLVALSFYLDPGDDATVQQRAAAREPSDRWLSRMVERGLIDAEQLGDPWGGSFSLRRTTKPAVSIAIEAANLELVSPGPDGKLGTRDDVADPFARAVPAGTAYALASGEDRLMAELARLAPGAEVLRLLLEAYQRVTAEVTEEEIGDAVGASVSEGWGSIGTGSYGTIGHGSGSGSGYGSGGGGIGGRSARAPKVRMGSISAAGGVSGFALVVRERFPSTLFFAPAIALDPSGKTTIPIPLSESVTTYLVEAVVWSADGWTWPSEMKIRVDKETVIDAPVPTYTTVGDVLRLPVRIGNRSSSDRKLQVAVFAPGEEDTPLVERKGVRVPAKDTVVEPVELKLPKAMKGSVTVGVRSAQGVALDAVRRPITVQHATRRVRRRVDILARASKAGSPADVLQLAVHKRATAREGSQVLVRVGAGLFALSPTERLAQWESAWTGEGALSQRTIEDLYNGKLKTAAFAVSAAWRQKDVKDNVVADAMRNLVQPPEGIYNDVTKEVRLQHQAVHLLYLAPVTKNLKARPALAADMQAVLRRMRKDLQTTVAELPGNPQLWALSAAALALTAPAKGKMGRVRELVRRVRRNQLVVGHHTWVAAKERMHETSAFLAIAELRLGHKKRALALLRTLATLAQSDRLKRPWARAMARRVALEVSPSGPPSHINLHIDGKRYRTPLSDGVARVPAPSLGRPGAHTITVDTGKAESALYHLEAISEHGLPWDLVPERPGSLVASIEGKIGRVGEQAKLILRVRNRSPRTIAKPIVEISLPAGTEFGERAKRELRRHTRGESEATRGTMYLRLAGLPPGGSREIPLHLRWSVGGALQGLGLASFPEDKPDDISIVKPRVLKIDAAKVTP